MMETKAQQQQQQQQQQQRVAAVPHLLPLAYTRPTTPLLHTPCEGNTGYYFHIAWADVVVSVVSVGGRARRRESVSSSTLPEEVI
ncbi:hypothetical protein E2C01_052686 [Portunus trituberculatus]|uniref:Uncharacterized protein n=1 Tax=Portunus trituberculatus TaxID=210409 RepID=A0A5B7GM57_PORTR|nr:hypothetical protein [Portunus trituberculatus]